MSDMALCTHPARQGNSQNHVLESWNNRHDGEQFSREPPTKFKTINTWPGNLERTIVSRGKNAEGAEGVQDVVREASMNIELDVRAKWAEILHTIATFDVEGAAGPANETTPRCRGGGDVGGGVCFGFGDGSSHHSPPAMCVGPSDALPCVSVPSVAASRVCDDRTDTIRNPKWFAVRQAYNTLSSECPVRYATSIH